MLVLDRQWDPGIQVSSSPMLRHLLTLVVGKSVGKNTKPLVLSISTSLKAGRCNLELHWRANDNSEITEIKSTMGKELPHIQEMVSSFGGELTFESETALVLKVPAAPQAVAASARQEMAH
jgi:hypothetical protein